VKKGALIYGFFGLVIGLTIGFWVANAFNRTVSLSTVNQNPVSAPQPAPPENNVEKLSQEEIKAAFASAENRDAAFQKDLGLALYRYSKLQNDSSFAPQLIKLLERANHLSNEKEIEILVALADTLFNAGQDDAIIVEKARNLYQKAVKLKPSEANIKTAFASTYLFSKPPIPEAAISELNAVLKQHPQNESALQLLVFALIQNGKSDAAEQKLSELEKINPNNSALPDLKVQLAQNKLNRNS
jgi:tetratricopeptide (TPR) repeat protein